MTGPLVFFLVALVLGTLVVAAVQDTRRWWDDYRARDLAVPEDE